jgi:hypothetical protein
MIARLEGIEAARSAMHYVAPVGEKDDYVARAIRNIAPFLEGAVAKARSRLVAPAPEGVASRRISAARPSGAP